MDDTNSQPKRADLRTGRDVERDAEDGPVDELLDVTGDDRGSRYSGIVRPRTPPMDVTPTDG